MELLGAGIFGGMLLGTMALGIVGWVGPAFAKTFFIPLLVLSSLPCLLIPIIMIADHPDHFFKSNLVAIMIFSTPSVATVTAAILGRLRSKAYYTLAFINFLLACITYGAALIAVSMANFRL